MNEPTDTPNASQNIIAIQPTAILSIVLIAYLRFLFELPNFGRTHYEIMDPESSSE